VKRVDLLRGSGTDPQFRDPECLHLHILAQAGAALLLSLPVETPEQPVAPAQHGCRRALVIRPGRGPLPWSAPSPRSRPSRWKGCRCSQAASRRGLGAHRGSACGGAARQHPRTCTDRLRSAKTYG
jgi:hypothetical protein